MRTFTLEEVVQSMLKSNINPAYKAHATRRLRKYVSDRSIEINSSPSRVRAAVMAVVTKRRN